MAGLTKSEIGFEYKPKNNKNPIIITKVIISLVVTSAKTLTFVSPSMLQEL
jgi:hypothetical protein